MLSVCKLVAIVCGYVTNKLIMHKIPQISRTNC